ncbi:MAG: helix-turn-helix transcriptional regulator [Rhodospirillales bacterium]
MSDTCVFAAAPESTPAPQLRERTVDLGSVLAKHPAAMLNEYEAAAIVGASVKTLRRWRCDGAGPRYAKVNGFTVRYKLGDLLAWLESQPTGGGSAGNERRGRGRPRKNAA